MLDCQSRKMLRYITDKEKVPLGYALFSEFFPRYSSYSGLSEQQSMACFRYLTSMGYVKEACDQDGVALGFEIEHKGHRHGQFTAILVWSFIARSVIVPIVAAILTVVALNALKAYMPEQIARLLL